MKKEYNQETVNYESVIDELSQEYIKRAKAENISIETDPKTLKNTIDMDLRENIPPQLLSIVSGVVKIIESLEKGDQMKIDKNRKISKAESKKTKRIQSKAASRLSFTEILDNTEEEKMRQALNEILEEINKKGRELINNRTVANLLSYKKMVRDFVEDAVDFGLKVNARRGYGLSGRTKILRTVSTIDERLVELTDIIIKQEKKGVGLLKKVGQIEGLLVNIFV